MKDAQMAVDPGHLDSVKHVVDAFSIGAAVATFIGWLPSIAALLSVVWSLIRIYESKTVQKLLGRSSYEAD